MSPVSNNCGYSKLSIFFNLASGEGGKKDSCKSSSFASGLASHVLSLRCIAGIRACDKDFSRFVILHVFHMLLEFSHVCSFDFLYFFFRLSN